LGAIERAAAPWVGAPPPLAVPWPTALWCSAEKMRRYVAVKYFCRAGGLARRE
jgi:hypothetical protein